jgi:hypothetical protein
LPFVRLIRYSEMGRRRVLFLVALPAQYEYV